MAKSFKDWTQTELKEAFGLVNKNGDCDELKNWLGMGDILMKKSQLTDFEQHSFDFIRNRLSINADILELRGVENIFYRTVCLIL